MTRKNSASETILRMLHTLQLIPRHSESARPKIGTRELLAKLENEGYAVSLRTLQRNLNDLQKVFPGLKNDGNRDALGWYWAADAQQISIPGMDKAQALALVLAEQFLAPLMPSLFRAVGGYQAAARRILGKQGTRILDHVRILPRTLPLKPAQIPPRVMEVVLRAFIEQKRIRVRYHARSQGTPGEYELNPLGLVCQYEVCYLLATAWDYEDVRQYALHRMDPKTIELLDTKATIPEDFDIDTYRESGHAHFRLSDRDIRLRLYMQQEAARHLLETPLADDQKITDPDPSGWVRVEARVPDTLQLRWWLLGFGDAVIVEKPVSLRNEIAGILQRASKQYHEKSAQSGMRTDTGKRRRKQPSE